MRALSYQLHVRPLFTATDVAHMQPHGLDLGSYDDVRANSAEILQRLVGGPGISLMPPVATTGPWPGEWIALFRRWIAEGHQP
jgi:hypothetical protein